MSLEEIANEVKASYPIRQEILGHSLLIETATSTFLAVLIGVKNPADSKSFGNKSTALSFNQKINLLLDIEALDKSNVSKFLTFMEIRNQFMHNSGANSYEKCLAFLQGKDTFLLKTYPQSEDLSKENQLKNAVDSLAKEVFTKITDLVDKIYMNISKEVSGETAGISLGIVTSSIKESVEIINRYFEETEPENDGKMGTEFGNIIWTLAAKKFKELEKEDTSQKDKGGISS